MKESMNNHLCSEETQAKENTVNEAVEVSHGLDAITLQAKQVELSNIWSRRMAVIVTRFSKLQIVHQSFQWLFDAVPYQKDMWC